MRKKIIVILLSLLVLMIPVSIFAYSNGNFQGFIDTITFRHNRMMDYYRENGMFEYMDDMWEEGYDCTIDEQHYEFIETQRQDIQDQLENGELSEDKANELLKELDDMIEFHNRYHLENNYRYCH